MIIGLFGARANLVRAGFSTKTSLNFLVSRSRSRTLAVVRSAEKVLHLVTGVVLEIKNMFSVGRPLVPPDGTRRFVCDWM
jgi:hypothetical protein